jgi:hypothetical protein
MAEDATVTPTHQSYVSRLQSCYKYLERSRVVKHYATDEDALQYFEKFCNDALPAPGDHSERDFRNVFRDIYYKNKRNFHEVIAKVHPYLILLTEARAIVMHFGVENVIYINWETDRYCVSVNTRKQEAEPAAAPASTPAPAANRAERRAPPGGVKLKRRAVPADDRVTNLTKQVEELKLMVREKAEKPTETAKPEKTEPEKAELDLDDGPKTKSTSWADQ